MLALGKLFMSSLVVLIPVGGIMATSSALSAPPKPLSVRLLKKFKDYYGWTNCQTFLSDKDRYSLLLACWKGETTTFEVAAVYYYWNGKDFEKALKLQQSSPKEVIFVTTENSRARKQIKDDQANSLNKMTSIDLSDNCRIEPINTGGNSSNNIHCHPSGDWGYADDGGGIKLPLKELSNI